MVQAHDIAYLETHDNGKLSTLHLNDQVALKIFTCHYFSLPGGITYVSMGAVQAKSAYMLACGELSSALNLPRTSLVRIHTTTAEVGSALLPPMGGLSN